MRHVVCIESGVLSGGLLLKTAVLYFTRQCRQAKINYDTDETEDDSYEGGAMEFEVATLH